MASPERPLSPHLQVYKTQYTMALSILHRATGVALSASLVLLAAWLVALAAGPDGYRLVAALLGSWFGWLVMAGVLAAFWYHFCTGIRHLVFDTGRCLEKKDARLSARIAIIAIVTLVGASLLAMLHFGG
jgi:succinate dehydrogenase / fumarate reductase, cytochrome b subunit